MNDTRGIPIVPGGRAGTREYNLECLAKAQGRTIPWAGTWITPEDADRISRDGP